MTSEKTKKSSLTTKILEALFICVATLVLLELALRGLEAMQYRQVQFEQFKAIYSDERDKPYLFGLKRNIKVRLEKGFWNYTIVTNDEGLRDAKNHGNIDKSVVFVGDSVVEGASVENDETTSAVFMKKTGVTSLNFGVGGGNTVQEYFWLREKFRKSYNTKLIVLGFCLNDLDGNRYRRFFDPQVGNWRLYDYLNPDGSISGVSLPDDKRVILTFDKSVAKGQFAFIKNIMKEFRVFVVPYEMYRAMQVKARSDNRDPLVSDEDVQMTRTYLDKMRNFAKENGAEFIVAIYPKETQLQKDYARGGRMQDQLIGILNELQIPYVDLYQPVKDAISKAPKEHWYYDELHPYKIGHQFIGTYLAEDFSKRYPQIFSQ